MCLLSVGRWGIVSRLIWRGKKRSEKVLRVVPAKGVHSIDRHHSASRQQQFHLPLLRTESRNRQCQYNQERHRYAAIHSKLCIEELYAIRQFSSVEKRIDLSRNTPPL